MSKKISVLLAAVMVTLMLAACGGKDTSGSGAAAGTAPATGSPSASASPEVSKAPAELTIKHPLGEAKVKTKPSKVVVFDFGILESLDKLGVEVTGVPQANLPSFLTKYKDAKYKNAGGLMEPDFEKIAAMNPEVIFISARQSSTYEEFKKIAPTVFMSIDNSKYMESFASNMKLLGDIFDKKAAVEEELKKVEASIQEVKAKAGQGGKNGLIVLATGGKLSAYGPGSRFGIIHDVLGVTPADTKIEVSTHGMSISPEFIAEKNPDYLFVVDRDAVTGGTASAKDVVENELVKKTKAFQNGAITYLDPNYWYLSGGGLVSVPKMIEDVSKAFK